MKENSHLPAIGITMGDPAGIGPEIIVKALSDPLIYSICRPVVFGSLNVMNLTASSLESSLKIINLESLTDISTEYGKICVYNVMGLRRVGTHHIDDISLAI